MVESKRRTSLLGVVALLAGGAALVLTRFNPTGISTVPVGPVVLKLSAAVAAGALLIALVAFLAAATSPRTSTGIPMLAALVCGGAVIVTFYPALLNRSPQPASAPPAAPPPVVTQRPAPTPAPRPEPEFHPRTIFDPDYSPPPQTPPNTPTPPSANVPPAPQARPAPAVRIDKTVAIRAAHDRLDAAREGVIRSLATSPGYTAAKADADAADADLKKARATYSPGSPELVTASQAALEAHGKLQKIITDAMAKDPASQDALHDLQSAQSAK